MNDERQPQPVAVCGSPRDQRVPSNTREFLAMVCDALIHHFGPAATDIGWINNRPVVQFADGKHFRVEAFTTSASFEVVERKLDGTPVVMIHEENEESVTP